MTQRYNMLTPTQYMKLYNIKSRQTVYSKINKGIIDAIDLNNGKTALPNWRILVPREMQEA